MKDDEEWVELAYYLTLLLLCAVVGNALLSI